MDAEQSFPASFMTRKQIAATLNSYLSMMLAPDRLKDDDARLTDPICTEFAAKYHLTEFPTYTKDGENRWQLLNSVLGQMGIKTPIIG